MPTNFRINSLLDVLAIKECSTTGVKCGNCDKRSKENHYCFQCCEFWCGECITFHNRMKANKDHYALALEDFQDHDFENILKRPTFCAIPGHEKKEIEFFCNICEVAICSACALTNHDGHEKILLEQAASERKLRVKSAIESQRKSAQTKRREAKSPNLTKPNATPPSYLSITTTYPQRPLSVLPSWPFWRCVVSHTRHTTVA